MSRAYDLVIGLTCSTVPSQGELRRLLRDFADELGWRPSYHVTEGPFVTRRANAHLMVEHGLEPSAVITFLNQTTRLSDLDSRELNSLMALSYNNLADWHLYVERERVTYCFNRAEPAVIDWQELRRAESGALSSEAFDQVVGRKPSPNFPALDEALVRTISDWKRALSAELGYSIPNENLSALFNAILFARAVEDYRRVSPGQGARLLEAWANAQNGQSLGEVVDGVMRTLIHRGPPEWLLDREKLTAFKELDRDTVSALLGDFYRNRFAPYEYDFSIMSKHALSRIYEHYSTLLHVQESAQTSFFPILPEEELNKSYGSVYTPQFIAGFFARFLRDQMLPPVFRNMRVVDPACGSGIFLRTLLELQCDPVQDGVTSDTIRQAFESILGVDVDENACQATRLSLAMLHLVLTSRLPESVHVVTGESIDYYGEHPELRGAFDAVIVNPPFVSIEMQSREIRERVAAFMGADAEGRIDMYLAFLRLGLEMLRPGGYGLFVVPHSFLLARNARGMRERLAREAWIRCLADLSAIRVFGALGSYVVLLVFQKKVRTLEEGPPASIIKCQDFVGHALEDYLQGRRAETSFYSIYEVEQGEFAEREWVVLPPVESTLRRKLRSLRELKEYASVRQGLITGADSVFIVDEKAIPDGESEVFVPFLADRVMERYHVPANTGKRVFYPFQDGRKLSGEELERSFPGTWEYLCSRRSVLEGRKPVQRGHLNWWEPVRPRSPEHLMRPKIVSPHLVILPRFCLDSDGRYAVSHGPVIYPSEVAVEEDLLRFLVAVLNSAVCYWYISTHSHKYSRGYTMLEVKTLRHAPVPDPSEVPVAAMSHLLNLVEQRLRDPSALMIEREIEGIVAGLYGLSSKERQALGIGD